MAHAPIQSTPTFNVTSDDLLVALEEQIDKSIRQFADNAETEIKMLRLQGLSDDDILNRLVASYKDKSGIWSSLKGSLGSSIDFGLNATANLTAVQEIATATRADQYEWILEPTAENCDTCLERDGHIKSYEQWQQLGLPGQFWKAGESGTTCGWYCKCALVPL